MGLIRKLDFDNGTADWVNAQNVGRPHSLTFQDYPGMGRVGRFEVRDGEDPIPPYGERSEVTGYGEAAGTRRWYYFKFRAETGFTNRQFAVFHQWHRSGNGESPVLFGMWDNNLTVAVNAGTRRYPYYRPIVPGQVYEVLLEINWSTGSDGFVRANINGETFQTNGPTMFDSRVYHKCGIYRDHVNVAPGIVYHTGLLVFDAPVTVAEARAVREGTTPPPPPPPPPDNCDEVRAQLAELSAEFIALEEMLTEREALLTAANNKLLQVRAIVN